MIRAVFAVCLGFVIMEMECKRTICNAIARSKSWAVGGLNERFRGAWQSLNFDKEYLFGLRL